MSMTGANLACVEGASNLGGFGGILSRENFEKNNAKKHIFRYLGVDFF